VIQIVEAGGIIVGALDTEAKAHAESSNPIVCQLEGGDPLKAGPVVTIRS
jgi:hypothetical protein